MVELFRRSVAILFAGVVGLAGAANAQPSPSGDPPARVGRLAFVQGTVSFHDRDQTDWAPAVANTPLTSGDALWTEPNARGEISIAGTRVRMDGGSQLDMLALDDSQTRMQLDQGRLDIKTFTYDTRQPYEVLTPRGTITLQQQGDYYVEAGSTQDPTRLGVRAGAAQIQAPNGQVLAVRAGEVGEISGDNDTPQLHTIQSAPPPMPAYWAERDRVVVYDQPPQYVTAGMTGYEDLNYYGSWSDDPDYGQVWAPRAVVAGWEPYRTGQWSYVQPWGWTWVDEQPWGFAPYHYGRWAHRDRGWVWVPPQRDLRPVYAPALVAFVGGVELGVAIGQQSRAPVGWFPLGPREVYVPPYSNDSDYYRRLNASARVQDQVMDEHWQRAQRREAMTANQQQTAFMNRRFATVVPAEDFARSRSVARVALQVPPERLAAAPVAPVAAPPAPTQSIRAVQAPGTASANRPNDPNARPPQGQANIQANVPTTQTHFANMQAIGRPQPAAGDRPRAPGPQIATTRPNEPNVAPNGTAPNAAPNAARPGLPPLAPRTGAAPPQLQGERTTAPGQPGQPATPPKPGDNRAVTTPQPPAGQPPAGQPQQPRPPGQANLPPVRDPNAGRTEPPKPGEPPRAQPQQRPTEQRPAPAAPQQQQQQGQQPAVPPQPQHQATPAPQPPHQAEPPRPQQAQQPAAPPQPQHQPAPAPQPQPQRQAEPPRPQGAQQPVAPPQPQRQAAPQPQPQAPAPPPAQARAPAPPPQPQAAPPQAHAPAPPPPQAAHPAPPPQAPPQQAHAPAPPPQQGQKQEEKK